MEKLGMAQSPEGPVFSRWFVYTSKPGRARKFDFWEPSQWLSQGYDMAWSCDSGALTFDRPFPAAPVSSRAESVTMALARCGNWTRLGAFLPPLALKWLQNSQSDLYILMNFPTLKKNLLIIISFLFFLRQSHTTQGWPQMCYISKVILLYPYIYMCIYFIIS